MGTKFRLSLPRTKFPLRVSAAQHETKIEKLAGMAQHYRYQQKKNVNRTFVLHDGPPYANGDPHMGHVLNKVLKDVTNRFKAMTGHCVHYRPGWDCHGLPIELKAFQDASASDDHAPLDVRRKARKFAEKAIKRQAASFKRWGLMADWDNPYTTLDKQYEANQIGVFYDMYKKGLIYRGVKPVYWSPSSRTALAEAELEYRDRVSSAVYVKFPVDCKSCNVDALSGTQAPVYALVWTTTPWTLLANRAICYNPRFRYSLLKTETGEHFIVLSNKVGAAQDILGSSCEHVCTFQGEGLAKWKYFNPLRPSDGLLPFLPGDHVSDDAGSGLVHTAPAHGPEDYQIGLQHKLDMSCAVDERGLYTEEVGEEFKGLDVLTTGNKAVLAALKRRKALVHSEDYVHRYPYDWRSKQPVIIRATKQWFAAVGGISPAEALEEVTMVPEKSYNRLSAMLEGRQDWCISRQRVWGVPIPVFYHKTTHEHLVNESTVRHLQEVFAQHGSDSWWSLPVSSLLPPSLASQAEEYGTGSDTMDVWFDSGTSWATVLQEHSGVADVYLEGSDQCRGWFQSSLITSYIAQGKSPYRSLVCHGFVLDSSGTKMSKSLGNVISPDHIIEKQNLGADTMRLWVASSDFTMDVNLSEQILKQSSDSLQKIRSTCRFMVGNLSDFSPEQHLVPYRDLRPLDRYMLSLLHQFCTSVKESYETYSYSKILHLVSTLVASDLSAFYFDIVKDCLYCAVADSSERRAAQSTLYQLLTHFTMALAPVLPYLTEEVALHSDYMQEGPFLRGWVDCSVEWGSPDLARTFSTLREVRSVVTRALDAARTAKVIGSSLEAEVAVYISDAQYLQAINILSENCSELLSEVFIVSNVDLLTQQMDPSTSQFHSSGMVLNQGREFQVSAAVRASSLQKCPRCWKYRSPEPSRLCSRCDHAERGQGGS